MTSLDLRDAATNGRFKAYPSFRYFAEPWISHSLSDYNIDKLSHFFEIREWCATTWGATQEYEVWRFFNRAGRPVNPHWCFDVNTTNQPMLRIYFRTDAEYALYKLKWM